MDAERFDTLIKALTASPTRRTALRLLAGSVLAAGMALFGRAEAKWGRKKKRKKKAPPCGRAGARCCQGGTCNPGAECNEVGYCRCEFGRRNCGGACLPKDDYCCVAGQALRHGQTHRCPPGRRCVSGCPGGPCCGSVNDPRFPRCDDCTPTTEGRR